METESGAPEQPQTTEQIAEQIVTQGEVESESSGETQVSEKAESAAQAESQVSEQPTPAEISAARKWLESRGHKAKKEDGRDVWFPFNAVEKMLKSYAETETAPWNTRYSTLENEHKSFKEQAENHRALIELADRDPDAFLQLVAEHDPRYQRYLPKQQPQEVEDPEPLPDIDLGNGRTTMSQEQWKKHNEWRDRRLLAQWKTQQEQERKDAEKQAQTNQSKAEKRRQILDAVQAKPEFGRIAADGTLSPFQQEVYDTFKGNPSMTLMEAFYEVKDRKRGVSEGETREKLVQDINAAPTSTSVSRSAGVVPPASSNRRRTTEDIAREIVSRSE